MKKAIRQLVKSEKNNHSESELNVNSAMITARLFSLDEYKKSRLVMFYAAKKGEVDTLQAIRIALTDKEVAVPFVTDGEIVPVRINSVEDLGPGSFGVLEPKSFLVGLNNVNPRDVDLVIVPGLAFDEKGNRVGYGKGYYDKFLKKISSASVVALAFDFQVLPSVPSRDHDVSVHKIITEKRTITCTGN